MKALPQPGTEYYWWLKEWASKSSDGCTKIWDWNLICCFQHDFGLQMGFDPRYYYQNILVPISKRANARLFRQCNIKLSKLRLLSPRSWIRWLAVASPFGGNTNKEWWPTPKDETKK